MTRSRLKWILFAAFVATVYLANLVLEHHGAFELDLAGSTLAATWGALFAGLAFGLRDALHETGGRQLVLVAIVCGAILTWWLSDGAIIPGGHASIAVASGTAFATSELVDLAVYEPLRARNWKRAVIASGIAGAIVDSLLFLWLAFGDASAWPGQTIVKALMVLAALPLVGWSRSRLPKHARR